MSARLASGVSVCLAYGLFVVVVCANGCGGSASRTATIDSGDFDVVGSGDVSSGSEAASRDGSGATGAESGTDSGSAAACTCPLPSTVSDAGLLYNGGTAAGTCPSTFMYDNAPNSWFSYSDGTVDSGSFTHIADMSGCDGPGSCAFHASGAGFTGYGAGVGFTLNDNSTFDASSFTGLDVYLKGTTTGTRGLDYAQANNTVHVKFVTSGADGGDPLDGDDYGAYCPISQDAGTCYSLCNIPFGGVARDGYHDAGVTAFDPQSLVKIQFEFSAYTPAPDSGIAATPVSFDVMIDNVAFYQ
jgi:hypothetical protein